MDHAATPFIVPCDPSFRDLANNYSLNDHTTSMLDTRQTFATQDSRVNSHHSETISHRGALTVNTLCNTEHNNNEDLQPLISEPVYLGDPRTTYTPMISEQLNSISDGLQQNPPLPWQVCYQVPQLNSVGTQFDSNGGDVIDFFSAKSFDVEVDETVATDSAVSKFTEPNSPKMTTELLNPVQDTMEEELHKHSLQTIPTDAVFSTDGCNPNLPKSIPTYQKPKIVVSNDLGHLEVPRGNKLCDLSMCETLSKPAKLVQQAYNRFVKSFESLGQKMNSEPDLELFLLPFTTEDQFLQGLKVLQRCYSGAGPRSLRDFLTSVSLIFAFSHTVDAPNAFHSSDSFSKSLYRSRHCLTDPSELELFFKIFNQVWYPQEFAQGAIYEQLRPETAFLTSVSSAWDEASIQSFPSAMHPSEHLEQDNLDELGGHDINQGFQNMLERCSLFIDCEPSLSCPSTSANRDKDLEYIMLQDRLQRTAARPVTSTTSDLAVRVIYDLQKCSLSEKHPSQISNTIKRLSDEQLVSIRELELALRGWPLTSSHQSPLPDQMDFLEDLARQCSQLAGRTRLEWQNGFRSRTLDVVIRLHFELHSRQSSSFKALVKAPSFIGSFAYPSQESSESFSHAVSPFSNSRSLTAPTSLLTPATSGTLAQDKIFRVLGDTYYPIDSALISPTLSDSCSEYSASSTPSAWASPSPSNVPITTSCPRCPTVFSGVHADQRRNLRRHMSDQHSVVRRLPCPEHGCSVTFSPARSDNRKRHLETQHPEKYPPTPTKTRKRKADR